MIYFKKKQSLLLRINKSIINQVILISLMMFHVYTHTCVIHKNFLTESTYAYDFRERYCLKSVQSLGPIYYNFFLYGKSGYKDLPNLQCHWEILFLIFQHSAACHFLIMI